MENEKIIKIQENEEENKNKTAVEIEDYCYRIVEMRDSIVDTISNIEDTIAKQDRLVEIVKKALEQNVIEIDEKEKEYFVKFCADIEQSCQDYKQQIDKLIIKRNLLNELLKRCDNNSENAQLISILCEAFGIFKY